MKAAVCRYGGVAADRKRGSGRKGGQNMFCIGDKVAHPMHGAGVIADIVREKVAGCVQDYYVFRLSTGGLVLKIPTASSGAVGLREVADRGTILELLAALPSLEVEMTANWNRRYRENLQRLKSGDLYEVARVIKGLSRRDSQQGLSTGERKMLHTAKQILISEIVLALGWEYEAVERSVNAAVSGEKLV